MCLKVQKGQIDRYVHGNIGEGNMRKKAVTLSKISKKHVYNISYIFKVLCRVTCSSYTKIPFYLRIKLTILKHRVMI